MKNVAIFASGNGTNAERVITDLAPSDAAKVVVVVTNNPKAGVINRAKQAGVAVELIDQNWDQTGDLIEMLSRHETDIILLLGYLKLLPVGVIEKYDGHIVNLHPALLPKYGGKGMYGHFVHEAVANSGDSVSGLTFHRVNNLYDDGEILYQAKIDLPENVEARTIQELENNLEAEKVAPAIRELIESGVI